MQRLRRRVLFQVGQCPGEVHVGDRVGRVQPDRFPAGIRGFGQAAAAPQDVPEASVGARQAGVGEDGGAVGSLGTGIPVLPAQLVALLGKLSGCPPGGCRGTPGRRDHSTTSIAVSSRLA